MIDPKEFREGNYFKWSQFASMGIGVDAITKDNHYDYSQLKEPIDLDISWVIKLGFEYYKPLRHYRMVIDDIWFEIRVKDDKFVFSFTNLNYDETNHMPPKTIKFVHKLQNLMYELIEKELVIED